VSRVQQIRNMGVIDGVMSLFRREWEKLQKTASEKNG
jgi:hypothetical protein